MRTIAQRSTIVGIITFMHGFGTARASVSDVGRRFAGPIVSFLLALGFQVSGFESLPLAFALWGLAAVWGLWAVLPWFRHESKAAAELLPRVERPTTAEVEAWRSAKKKQDGGEKLSRKERKALANPRVGLTRRGFVETLGRQLDLGRFHPDSIRWEGEHYQRDWAEFIQTKPSKDAAWAWLEAQPHKAEDDAAEWRANVRAFLNQHLDSSYAARFDNDHGITPGTPPDTLTDPRYIRVWQEHDLRMQRLHQLIEELSRKWNL
jgi:hypothetical protein